MWAGFGLLFPTTVMLSTGLVLRLSVGSYVDVFVISISLQADTGTVPQTPVQYLKRRYSTSNTGTVPQTPAQYHKHRYSTSYMVTSTSMRTVSISLLPYPPAIVRHVNLTGVCGCHQLLQGNSGTVPPFKPRPLTDTSFPISDSVIRRCVMFY
jgi:hypothetical protein